MISPEVLGTPIELDRFEVKNKANVVKYFQDITAVIDSMIICLFSSFAIWIDEYLNILNIVTGFNYSKEELELVGERIYNAERLFNIFSFGDGREYDTLPKRLLEEPIPEGPSKGYVAKLDDMLDEYYEARGWIDGRPKSDKLKNLDLDWVISKFKYQL